MKIWIICYDNIFYQFNTPPDMEIFPYYKEVKEYYIADKYDLLSAMGYALINASDNNFESLPDFLELDDLQNEEIKEITIGSLEERVHTVDFSAEIKNLSDYNKQYLYELISREVGKPFYSNGTETTLEKIREYIVNSNIDTLSKINKEVDGCYPLLNIFSALGSKEVYHMICLSSIFINIRKEMLENISVQDMAKFIGYSSQEYIEALSKYLPSSVTYTISKQRIYTVSDIIHMLKALQPHELEIIIKELDRSTIGCINNLHPLISNKKESLVNKLKNNKLI